MKKKTRYIIISTAFLLIASSYFNNCSKVMAKANTIDSISQIRSIVLSVKGKHQFLRVYSKLALEGNTYTSLWRRGSHFFSTKNLELLYSLHNNKIEAESKVRINENRSNSNISRNNNVNNGSGASGSSGNNTEGNKDNSNGNSNNSNGTSGNDTEAKDDNSQANNGSSTTSSAIEVSYIKLEKNNLDIFMGDQVRLKCEVFPENASKKEINWSCDNIDVLDLSDDGVIIAKSEGIAIIEAAAKKGLKAQCVVTVKRRSELEALKLCKDSIQVKGLLDNNTLNIDLQRYSTLSSSAKNIVAVSIYENKDTFQYKNEVQQHVDLLLANGYKINGNNAILIEGIENNIEKAVANTEVTNIFMPRGDYKIKSNLKVNRRIIIEGEGIDLTKLDLDFTEKSSEDNIGIDIDKNGELSLLNLNIDGLYDQGSDITYALQSEGNLTLKQVKLENIGKHKTDRVYGIVINEGVLSVDSCVFSNIKGTAVISNNNASLNIGTEKGNLFEDKLNTGNISAIVVRSNGRISIENNTITGYKGRLSSGMKLNNGGVYIVKNNIIIDNYVGIKSVTNILINTDLKGSIEEVLLKGNPECKGNEYKDVQIIK